MDRLTPKFKKFSGGLFFDLEGVPCNNILAQKYKSNI